MHERPWNRFDVELGSDRANRMKISLRKKINHFLITYFPINADCEGILWGIGNLTVGVYRKLYGSNVESGERGRAGEKRSIPGWQWVSRNIMRGALVNSRFAQNHAWYIGATLSTDSPEVHRKFALTAQCNQGCRGLRSKSYYTIIPNESIAYLSLALAKYCLMNIPLTFPAPVINA